MRQCLCQFLSISVQIAKGLAYLAEQQYVLRSILETAKYPDNWKLVDVKPLHKNGAKNIISNYRPVANLSRLSLSFERLLFKHLYNFIAPKINSSQHGFMKNRSTTSQLLLHLKLLHDSLDIGEEVFTLYLDFCKAFDKVNHYLLIEILKNFGIDWKLLHLLSSYLEDRSQRTVINNIYSEYLPINSGVPQGSVLGPLLFLVLLMTFRMCLKPLLLISLPMTQKSTIQIQSCFRMIFLDYISVPWKIKCSLISAKQV